MPKNRRPGRKIRGNERAERPGAEVQLGLQLPGFIFDEQLGRYFRIPPGGQASGGGGSSHPSTVSPPATPDQEPLEPCLPRSLNLLSALMHRQHGLASSANSRRNQFDLLSSCLSRLLPLRHRVQRRSEQVPPGHHRSHIEQVLMFREVPVIVVMSVRDNVYILEFFEIVEGAAGPAWSHDRKTRLEKAVPGDERGRCVASPRMLSLLQLDNTTKSYRCRLVALSCFLSAGAPVILVCMNGHNGSPARAQILSASTCSILEYNHRMYPEYSQESYKVCKGAVFSSAHSHVDTTTPEDQHNDLLAFGGEGVVMVRSLASLRLPPHQSTRLEVSPCGEHVNSLQFANDGQTLFAATSRGNLCAWRRRQTDDSSRFFTTCYLKVLVFSSPSPLSCLRVCSSREVLVGDKEGRLAAVDADSGVVLRHYSGHASGDQFTVAEELDLLCATGQDKVTRFWRLSGKGGPPLFEHHAAKLPGERRVKRDRVCSVLREGLPAGSSLPLLMIGHPGGLDMHYL